MTDINESGMTFRFPDENCFVIETDPVVMGHKCIKACECVATITAKGKDLAIFLEAKSSAPKSKECRRELLAYDSQPFPERWFVLTDFDKFISDICLKFEDSFSTFYAMSQGHHGKEAAARLPKGCNAVDIRSTLFVLVINGFKEDWLSPLNDAIKRQMRHFLNSWNLPDTSVKTLTPEGAATIGLPVV